MTNTETQKYKHTGQIEIQADTHSERQTIRGTHTINRQPGRHVYSERQADRHTYTQTHRHTVTERHTDTHAHSHAYQTDKHYNRHACSGQFRWFYRQTPRFTYL